MSELGKVDTGQSYDNWQGLRWARGAWGSDSLSPGSRSLYFVPARFDRFWPKSAEAGSDAETRLRDCSRFPLHDLQLNFGRRLHSTGQPRIHPRYSLSVCPDTAIPWMAEQSPPTMAPSSNPDDPPSPFPLTAVDRSVLAMTDEEFHPHTWEELKQIIGVCSWRPPSFNGGRDHF